MSAVTLHGRRFASTAPSLSVPEGAATEQLEPVRQLSQQFAPVQSVHWHRVAEQW